MTTTSNAQRAVTALLGTKLGMTQVWDADGRVVPVTAIQVDTNVVTQVRNEERDGYEAVQLAFGTVDPRRVTKPLVGHFENAGVTPRRHVAEVRTSNAADYSLGQEIAADVFEAGQKVDVTGTTKGKGTAGVMKRHGFHGVGASHGAHRNHRKPGSIGAGTDPSRVIKGKKMPGQYGNVRHTALSIRVEKVDAERNLIYLRGSVAGPTNGIVFVRKQG